MTTDPEPAETPGADPDPADTDPADPESADPESADFADEPADRVTQPAPGGGPQQAPRRRFDPLAAVVLTVLTGVVIAAVHHPRTGMFVACGGLALGAALRLVLSPRNAGSLVVRKRRVDVIVLGGLALALGVLAAVTPFPAGQG